MQKPKAPPPRPLFMTAIGIVVLGKVAADASGMKPIVWVAALVGLVLCALDVFRWLHLDAAYQARSNRGGDLSIHDLLTLHSRRTIPCLP